MSKAPFSKPDVNDVVSSSHVFKIRSSLNHWSRRRLPESRSKHLFGIVVIALLVLGLQLTACGNAESPLGSASPTSNSTSQSSTPTSTSTSTTGPTTGPTTGQTVVPAADPKSFTVTAPYMNQKFFFVGTAGQQATIDSDQQPPLDQPYIEVKYPDPDNPSNPNNPKTAGPINWSVLPSTDDGGNWLDLDPRGGSLEFGKSLRVKIKVSVPQGMPSDTYTGKIVFSPNTSGVNQDDVVLDVGPSGPTVSSINPTSGPAAGGTSVTMTGTGFTGATGVSFGETAASGFTVDSDTQITAASPAGSGTVNVTVTTPNGTAFAQFTYNAPPAGPTVSSINPTSGPAAGGTSVTITGTGFTGATGVSFGGTAASNFTVDSDTQITAISPAGSGTVTLTVTTPNGTASAQFTYT